MSLTTGDFSFYYGTSQPAMSDLTGQIGGSIDTGNPFVFSNTGLMPTGTSALAGAGSDVYYAKLFVRHEGLAGDYLSNPQLYISNDNVSDQVQIALDPCYTGFHSDYTGTASNRQTIPAGLATGDFYNYRGDSALIIDSIATGAPITLDSGDSIGFWVRVTIPAGLSSSYTNTFDVVLRGEN